MTKSYILMKDKEKGLCLYGGARQLWQCKNHEVILSGPAETGKTIAALHKLDALMWKYPNCQASIIRKVYSSARSSVVQSYEKKVIPEMLEKGSIIKYGGEMVQFYQYPNGSRIWVAGMDNPTKILSAERDFIYVNQTEELTLEDWEMLITRCTGRAGNSPYQQLFGDANPGPQSHWILQRAKANILTIFYSNHEDNPSLYDQNTKQWTAQGVTTLSRLDNLSGVRKERLRYGKWVSAEGQIYTEYNPSVHLINKFNIPKDWRRIRAIDFGYNNPFVCLWIAIDNDNRMYVYRQIYKTNRLVSEHTKQILELSKGENIEVTICDHDSEHRAAMLNAGIDNSRAVKDVLAGIEKVKKRLQLGSDNKPRLFIMRNSLVQADHLLISEKKPVCLEDEFESYIWHQNKEQPIKEYDHALDALRYAVMYLDLGISWVR